MAGDYKNRYRPYDREYQARPEQKRKRANRNQARALMIRKYGKAYMKGKDVDHKNGNALDTRRSNLQIMSASKNRAKH